MIRGSGIVYTEMQVLCGIFTTIVFVGAEIYGIDGNFAITDGVAVFVQFADVACQI